jgi:biopolymer transport protein ExbD
MKLKRQSRFHHEVSTGALNDIMFFLLLFFLIVSTVANPQVIKLMLPKASDTEIVNKQQIVVSVTAEKVYHVGADVVAFEDLEAAIRNQMKTMPSPTVVLRLDRTLDVQSMVDVLELGMRMQVKMVLQTSTE